MALTIFKTNVSSVFVECLVFNFFFINVLFHHCTRTKLMIFLNVSSTNYKFNFNKTIELSFTRKERHFTVR